MVAQTFSRGSLASAGVDTGKENRKFLTTVAVGTAATPDLLQLSGNHAQSLVAGGVAVAIVEALEMVDIDHGDGVVTVEGVAAPPRERVVPGRPVSSSW